MACLRSASLSLALTLALSATSVRAAELTPDTINAAEPGAKAALSNEKPTPLGVRLQVGPVAVGTILPHGPSSVEVMDGFILENTKQSAALDHMRRTFIDGDPGALLCV